MFLNELQRIAKTGETFIAYTMKGRRMRCRWVDAPKGLFNIEEADGRPLKSNCLCDVKGAPCVRVKDDTQA